MPFHKKMPTNRVCDVRCRGYSLIELLLVLAIIAVMAAVGMRSLVGNRSRAGVRAVMDDVEGFLLNAQNQASATGQDVVVTTRGAWNIGDPMNMTFTGAAPASDFNLATIVRAGAVVGIKREHQHAGIVVGAGDGSDWWATTAIGNTAIDTIAPFSDNTTGFLPVLADPTRNLVKGTAPGDVVISGASKRFTAPFYILVVGLRDGTPITGGPMGVLLVQNNSSTVFRFYNPGTADGGDGQWRRM